jgi:signal transduction histidine kinase
MAELENSKLFSQLNPEELAALRRGARQRKFGSGQEIFKEGDPGDGLYFVSEGLVEISARVGEGAQHVFSEIGPGGIFGEMAVVEDEPRSASAVARKETRAWFISRDEMRESIKRSPALALALLKQISNRLREFNHQHIDEILQAERLAVVGRFARSIIHDLKNPLHTIGLSAEMIGLDRVTAATLRQAKTTIRGEVDRINGMVGEVLEFTQGSRNDLILTPMDYSPFVLVVAEQLRPELAARAVEIQFVNAPPSVRLLVHPKRLCRVFRNLAHNAAEAMPEGGRIRLRFQSTDKEVITEMEDTGPGIAPEIADRVFQAFVSFGKIHGTGLGLSICKRIVEDHRGWIAARNEPGGGAVISFGLPRVEGDRRAD